MGNLLLKQGKNDEARAEFQAAVNVVHGIGEDLTDLALKEGYLQSKPIQELLAQAEGVEIEADTKFLGGLQEVP